MNNWSLPDILTAIHDDIERQLAAARKSIVHPGSKGAASERLWLELFEKYLPRRYRAASAHIVDSLGAVSDQIDVVVFDRQYSPLMLELGGQTIVPAECVYAVFEVKQEINRETIALRFGESRECSTPPSHEPSHPAC